MKQWVADRYNKGQDKYWILTKNIKANNDRQIISVNEYGLQYYDFLFNPKWLFAKAFWKDNIGGEHLTQRLNAYIMSMAIAPDPLKYLEYFK